MNKSNRTNLILGVLILCRLVELALKIWDMRMDRKEKDN